MNPIKKYRLAKNMTQQDLADRLQINRSTIAQWETGGNIPRVDTLVQLAKIFKCKLDDLVYSKM